MDVSPQLLRDVEFREQWRGYNPDEVDDFLERLAVALGQLQDQLGEAVDRAARAERRVLEGSADEDEIRRTLVLAQRTADAALAEAAERAATLEAEAHERCAALTLAADEHAARVRADAEAHAARVRGDAEEQVTQEVAPLLAQRDALQHDVDALRSWAGEIRIRMADELRQQLHWLEGPEAALPPPPEVSDVELPDLSSSGQDAVGDAHELAGPSRAADGAGAVGDGPAPSDPAASSGPDPSTFPDPDPAVGQDPSAARAPFDDDAPGDGAPRPVGAEGEVAPAERDPDATGVYDVLADLGGPGRDDDDRGDAGQGGAAGRGPTGAPRPEREDHGDHGVEGGPLATAAAADPFLAELRRAVTDDEPLGPRDRVEPVAGADGGDGEEEPDLSTSVFRRRRRQ